MLRRKLLVGCEVLSISSPFPSDVDSFFDTLFKPLLLFEPNLRSQFKISEVDDVRRMRRNTKASIDNR